MKRINHSKIIVLTIGSILISLFLNSCGPFNQIITENDVVFSTNRASVVFAKRFDENHLEAYWRQTFVKEGKPGNAPIYTMYDEINIGNSGFGLKEEVYLIVDNEVFQMKLNKIENDFSKSMMEYKSGNPQSNQENATSLREHLDNNKYFRFSYNLSEPVIAKIKNAEIVQYRYYSGPRIYTATLVGYSLMQAKKIINQY